MANPRVSIITGTIPSRIDDLLGAMRDIREQTIYADLEHLIAVEGHPAEVAATVARIEAEAGAMDRHVPTRAVGLGRWWSRFLAASEATVPFQTAQWMASGDYLCWWADDERALAPDHLEAMVEHLERTDSDFVYPYVELTFADGGRPLVIGNDPPQVGQVTHCLFRAELLDYRGFTTHVGPATDWDQVTHWLDAGARWSLVPRLSFSHRADKRGDGPRYRPDRQPLRGHQSRVPA